MKSRQKLIVIAPRKARDFAKQGKIIVVVGPTASGKSDMAIRLARKYNGEVISADSRQVYAGMDLGTGKVPKSIPKLKVNLPALPRRQAGGEAGSAKFKVRRNGDFYSEGVRHWMLDVASPARQYSVTRWRRGAERAITDIIRRGKVPIICGGTGFYADTLVYGLALPAVPPNPKLRAQLEKLTVQQLFKELTKYDPERSRTIDRYNKRRLIRALEIIAATGKPVPAQVRSEKFKVKSGWDVLYLGISIPKEKLVWRIEKRLDARLRPPTGGGMAAEVRRLHAQGVSWKRLENFGLEYRWISRYLKSNELKVKSSKSKTFNFKPATLNLQQMREHLLRDIVRYAKRQMTWFKRNHSINWIKTGARAQKLTRRFLDS